MSPTQIFIPHHLLSSFYISLIESIYLSTSPLLNPSSIPCHMSFCLPFIPHPLISIISHNQIFSNSSSHNLLPSNTNLYIFMHLFSFFSPLLFLHFHCLILLRIFSIYYPSPSLSPVSILHPISSHPPSITISYPQSLNSSSHQTIHYCHLLPSIIYPISPSPKLHTPPSPPFKYTLSLSL